METPTFSKMVSIITPAYNSSRHLAGTIESVLAQTYGDWEMIIADDASTDPTRSIVRRYSTEDDRIRLLVLPQHKGPAEARNAAIDAARGRYIAFLDSDDLWHPQKLEKQIRFMEQHGHAFTFTSYQRIRGRQAQKMNVVPAPRHIHYRAYLRNTVIGTLTVVIDRQQTGPIRMPNIRSSHDMALWCKLLKNGLTAYGLQETLAYYRVMAGSHTGRKIRAAKDVWKVYRNIEKIRFVPSLFNFVFYACNAASRRMTRVPFKRNRDGGKDL